MICTDKRRSPGVVLAFLAKKGAMIAAQDRDWTRDLPHGWFAFREAAVIWCVTTKTASRRLILMRADGAVRHRGSGSQGRWMVARRNE